MDPLYRQSLVLSHNETIIIPYTLFVNKTGYDRVEFMMFNESVPGPEVSGVDRINSSLPEPSSVGNRPIRVSGRIVQSGQEGEDGSDIPG